MKRKRNPDGGPVTGIMGKKERREIMRIISHALASALRNVRKVDVVTIGYDPTTNKVWRQVNISFSDSNWGRKRRAK